MRSTYPALRCSRMPPGFCQHSPSDRWFVDETYIKVNGVWRYVYRAVDQYGQVISVPMKHRLRPMRGLRTDRTAHVVIAGHAFIQNLRRGHYELGPDVPAALRAAAAFTELAGAI